MIALVVMLHILMLYATDINLVWSSAVTRSNMHGRNY